MIDKNLFTEKQLIEIRKIVLTKQIRQLEKELQSVKETLEKLEHDEITKEVF